jgi:hypothetical protein
MRNLLIVSILLLTAACNSSTSTGSVSDTSVTTADTMADRPRIPEAGTNTTAGKQDLSAWDACYLHLEGRDSTTLKLRMRGSVEGEFNWIPAEKDARRGTIVARISGDMIKGTWTFMQEGMKDSLPVEFRLKGTRLYQQQYKANPSTGRQYLDAASPFDIVFEKVGCRNVQRMPY